ncbi:unnamed protein product [Euphydryas editha]|uniref:HTH CENPB-type domain-containing protein n=1 Tax=Euphydryas editha TaxID=104508 RepID=A0AAU9TUB2_EUPED|nr:unnamed protein product [Euphydryas editha]
MKEAVNKVLDKELTLRQAAKIYELPYTTLQRRVCSSRGLIKTRGGQPALDENAEKILVDRLLHLAGRGFGITPKAVRKYAFEFAERQKLKHNFNRKLEMAGQDWFHRFMKRNKKLTIRKPEVLSRASIDGMKKEKVAEFFKTLETVVDKTNLRGRPECVYNVDETGIPLNNRPPNIIAQKGAKDVVSVTNVERGENVTILACMNATGHYIPPFVLFKGITKVAFGGIFKQAWNQAATVGNAVKGFEKTGIFPLNVNALPDHKFYDDEKSDIVVSQAKSTRSQQVQSQYQSISAEQVQSEQDTEPLPSTSSQQSYSTQSSSITVIKEILPSPVKTPPVTTRKHRKPIKPRLHLTSPESKISLLEKDLKKRHKTDNKAVEKAKKTDDNENLKKKKNKKIGCL